MEAKLFVFAAVAISEVFSACEPTGTKFENFQKTPRRSIKFTVTAVSKKCPGLNEFYYAWEIKELPGFQILQTSSAPSIVIDGYTFSSETCFVKDYLLTVKVSHYPDMSYAGEAGEIFHFAPDPLHIEILGGSEKTHLAGYDLVMDAQTHSRDLSYPPGEDAFAGNSIKWTISPTIEGYTPPNELLITVPGSLLKEDSSFLFMVEVTRSKIPNNSDVGKSAQLVEIIPGDSPQLNILCIRNCINPHHLEVTVFTIHCAKNCHDLMFYWNLEPPASQSKIDFGDGFDKLVILNGAYNSGDLITVSANSGRGSFVKVFQYVTGIKSGNCSIYPEEGISSITKFVVNCTGFESPYGVVIYNIFQLIEDEEVLINEESYFDTSEVYLSAAEPAILKIEVQDNAFLLANIFREVTVKKFLPLENIKVQSAVKNLVLSSDSTSITSYSLEGFNNEAVQLISSLVDTIEYLEMDNSTVRDLHKHMAEAIFRMQPGRFATAFQRMVILLKLERHKLKDDTATSELMARSMMDSSFQLHKMHNHQHDLNIPQTYIEEFIEQTFNLSSDLLRKNQQVMDVLDEPTPAYFYDSYDDFVQQKIQIREDFKSILTCVVIALQTNCITALYRALPDEKAKFYHNDFIAVQTERRSLIRGKSFTVTATGNKSDSKVFLPIELINELSRNHVYVDYQIGLFKWNPFWWEQNPSSFATRFLLFDMFDNCNKIRNLRNPLLIDFEVLSTPTVEKSGTLTKESLVVHRIELEPHQTFVAQFDNVPPENVTYKVTWADCHCGDADFDSPRMKVIAKNGDPSEKSLEIRNGPDPKVVFVCIKKVTPEVSYKMILTTFACLYWHLKLKVWRKDGCSVKQATLHGNTSLVCECRHFSLFVGQIFVPPNSLSLGMDIDFKIVFVRNYLMMLIITGILLLWIFFLALAHRMDKSVQRRNTIHKLDDNVPGDRYPYLVVIFTGVFFDSPTTADVAFQLIGEQGKSRIHLIRCQGVEVLQRNGQDWFTLYSPAYLGHLKKIKIWHNCKGKSPHWYCERVIVQDLKAGMQYCFTVKKWFSLIWGTGKIYREIRIRRPVSKIPEILFMTQLERDLKDKHIWMSILVRDFQSNFNSKERVSAGFCFLFLSMLANAMFYGVPVGTPSDSIDRQSNFFVTVAHIIIFIESWLIATPMGLFIVFLFRNSRPI